MRVINVTTGEEILKELNIADTFVRRFMGLMGKKRLCPGFGLKIEPCSSIHTFNMRFAIDVLFVSEDHKVLEVLCAMTPGKVSSVVKGSRYVIEGNANELSDKVKIGDEIQIL